MTQPWHKVAAGRRASQTRATKPWVRKFLGVGERQVRVIATDATPDRMGDIVEPYGADLTQFRKNPIVLFGHDQQQPIARCTIALESAALVATISFPDQGISERADEILRLLKAGILGAVSIGFLPLEWEPIKGGGLRFTRWELLELSVVSVPANPSALVTERSISLADDATAARLARARAMQRRLDGVARPAVYETDTGAPRTREAARAIAKRLRERHGLKRLDPAVIAAEAQFRMRGS